MMILNSIYYVNQSVIYDVTYSLSELLFLSNEFRILELYIWEGVISLLLTSILDLSIGRVFDQV